MHAGTRHLMIVGINHRTAPVEVRERLYFSDEQIPEALPRLLSLPELREVCLLCTCNRVEVYAVTEDLAKGAAAIRRFLAEYHQVPEESLEPSLYLHRDAEAVRHTLRVASSLDSMVVGEPQILGQVKAAFEQALQQRASGLYLNRLFSKAFSVAKRVRTETRIAENAVSIGYAAVELAKKIFGSLAEKEVLLLGAGEMGALTARHLLQQGVHSLVVSSRTFARAEELARDLDGRAIPFDQFLQEIRHADIVLSSTGAPHYVLTREQILHALRERRQRPIFLIDIAVPRDIEPSAGELDNVYLYNIDDLQGVVDANLKVREREARKAEALIDQEVETFLSWGETLDIVPTIVALREQADQIQQRELDRAWGKLGSLDERQRAAIEALAHGIVNKLLHAPLVTLKEEASGGDKGTLIELARRLFRLDQEEAPASPHEGGEDAEERK